MVIRFADYVNSFMHTPQLTKPPNNSLSLSAHFEFLGISNFGCATVQPICYALHILIMPFPKGSISTGFNQPHRAAFCQHERWQVGVCGRDSRHDRRVYHEQILNRMHLST
jgi:hypothetical protein